ncbi:alginate lyase family protein [Sphaerisporangium sp. TRM90804]|uniref:alginate lyase family protein n=1 Tax=Sphaerisporangium sp. TRM90804 TaxID=3031113 RepID=UPI002447106D|nr:alginate lyase family protein [Sphaerisporangium sp. TRM90804]MDH2426867.1 alginate lyase family protein [Sphaerisporangium sp. TRM90804]
MLQPRRTLVRLAAGLSLTVTLAAGALTAPASAGSAQNAARAAAPATFTHPGVLVSRPQLDFVRTQVNAGAQPWRAAYDQMMASQYASLSRTPKPRAVVECGSYSNPNLGCTEERQDAIAAYTLALAWYITRDSRYADKAIQIMDAWSAVITDHTNSNAPLQTGWAGSSWPKAAEIIRYTYTGWPATAVNRFATMLRDVYLPEVINGSNSNGNWELTMMEAAIGIAVFLEDRSAYDRAVARFRGRVPAYIYVAADGALPKAPPNSSIDTRDEIIRYWQGQTTFSDGLSQETCRDFTHTGYGISSISHVAETSRIQGQDLYPEISDRLRHALGFHAKYQLGAAVPSSLCGGALTLGLGPVTEVGFNALSNRMGIAMTNTRTLTERQRPAGTNHLFVAWETLTHAGNPN